VIRVWIVAIALAVAGCRGRAPSPQHIELLGECFAGVAYETIRAEQAAVRPAPEPKKCCGKCKNGLVRSGDGQEWVSCPCEDSCPCKAVGLLPPKNCTTGKCRK
jgi:hypothetical protein